MWVPKQQAEQAHAVFESLHPMEPRADYVMKVKWMFMTHPEYSLSPISPLDSFYCEEAQEK